MINKKQIEQMIEESGKVILPNDYVPIHCAKLGKVDNCACIDTG